MSPLLITMDRRWLSSRSIWNQSTSTGLGTFHVTFSLYVSLMYVPQFISFPRALLLELKQMKDLHHDHLTRWVGACLDEGELWNRMPIRRTSVLNGTPPKSENWFMIDFCSDV